MTAVEVRDYGCGGSRPRRLETIGWASRAPRRPWWERPDLFWRPDLYQFQPRWQEQGHCETRPRLNRLGDTVNDWVWVPDFEPLGSRLLRRSEHVKGVVSALAAFHQMTAGQLAAHLGFPSSKIAYVLKPMWDSGLVERAVYPKQGTWAPKLDHVYRLRVDKALETWLADLDDDDWLAVTLGVPVGRAGHFVRHNLLVAELVLRLEEVAAAPLQAVFGERYVASNRLFGHGVSGPAIFGDACVVREDGLRIVVELVRRQRASEVEMKMAKWGQLLSSAPFRTHGTVVVFLNASLPGPAHVERATSLRRCHSRVLSPEALSTGRTGSMYARSSIYLASWAEWFPGPQLASCEFTQLAVCYSPDGTTWKRGALLPGPAQDVLAFSPADPGAFAKPGTVVLGPARAAGLSSAGAVRYLGVPGWLNGPFTSAAPVTGSLGPAA